jgi:CRP/FNR family cyclic AMP-dependent transcriptional regulator
MAFSAPAFLSTTGAGRTVRQYGRSETIFTSGDAGKGVLYIRTGGVRLSAVSKSGKVAEVATLGPGEFFGEGCLAGQPLRTGSATAMTPTTILFIGKSKMASLLQHQRGMSDRFISHLLCRNICIQEDLIVQLARRRSMSVDQAAIAARASGRVARPGAPAGSRRPAR